MPEIEGNFFPEFRDAGADVKNEVVSRMDRGIDTQERPLIPYSDAYAKKRAKTGRESSRVTMTYSGRMRRAIQVVAAPDSVAVGIPPGRHESVYGAAHQYGLGHMPQRRWFGLTRNAWRVLLPRLKRRIMKKFFKPGKMREITQGGT